MKIITNKIGINKPKTWSRKGECPSCHVGGGSKHRGDCTLIYVRLETKPSEIFEGENSSLKKTFDEAVTHEQILIDQRRAAIEENLKSMNNCRVFEPHTMTYTKLKIDNSPRGSLISLLGAMNCDTAKPWVDEIIHQARAEERERVGMNDKIYGIAVEVIGDKDKPKEIAVYISTEKNHKTIRYVPTVQLIPDSFGFRYEGRDLTDKDTLTK